MAIGPLHRAPLSQQVVSPFVEDGSRHAVFFCNVLCAFFSGTEVDYRGFLLFICYYRLRFPHRSGTEMPSGLAHLVMPSAELFPDRVT